MTTDIDGSPLLILSKREAQALCEYFRDENYNRQFYTLSSIWDKAEAVCNEVTCERRD